MNIHTFLGIVMFVRARASNEGKEGCDANAGFLWAGRTQLGPGERARDLPPRNGKAGVGGADKAAGIGLSEYSGVVMGDNGERGVEEHGSGDFGGGDNIREGDRSEDVDGAGERLAKGSSSRRSGGGEVLAGKGGGGVSEIMLGVEG